MCVGCIVGPEGADYNQAVQELYESNYESFKEYSG